MPDFPLPGYANFAPLVAAQNTTVNEQNYASNQLAQLGQQISNSISTNNMRQEAQQIAPLLSQHYQQGLASIGSGDYASGLSQIYGANSIASQNPLLKPVAQQAAVGADMAMRGGMRMQQAANTAATRADASYNAQLQQNNRTQFVQGELDDRQKASLDQQNNPKPPTISQKLGMVDKFNTSSDNIFKAMKSADNMDDYISAFQQYQSLRPVMLAAGLDANNSYIEKSVHNTISDLDQQLQENTQKLNKDPDATTGWFHTGQKIKDIVSKLQAEKNTLVDGTQKSIKAGYTPQAGSQPQSQSAPQIPPQAIQMLKQNPALAPQFNAKYGSGAADQILNTPTP